MKLLEVEGARAPVLHSWWCQWLLIRVKLAKLLTNFYCLRLVIYWLWRENQVIKQC